MITFFGGYLLVFAAVAKAKEILCMSDFLPMVPQPPTEQVRSICSIDDWGFIKCCGGLDLSILARVVKGSIFIIATDSFGE